jgi:opacity protein-like surface antigen
MWKVLFRLLVTALALTPLSSNAATLEEVLGRLNTLEKENAALRARVQKLETPKASPKSTTKPQEGPGKSDSEAFAYVPAKASGAASAADIIPSWAGFYIGGHGGYGWQDDPFNLPTSAGQPDIIDIHARGWVAGGQVGYNWQYAAIVGGLELDVSATGIQGATTVMGRTINNALYSETRGDTVNLLGTARGRLGWALSPNWLLYGTGGLAWQRLDRTYTIRQTGTSNNLSFGSVPADLFGWVLGAGVEARIMGSSWIARLEYLHYDFGHSRGSSGFIDFAPGGGGFNITEGDLTIDVVRAGLSYKFGS